MSDIVISARSVTKQYRSGPHEVRAVDDVSLDVSEGRLVCLYGASGSGKSTLLHLLAGLEEPDAGEIVIAGVSLQGRSPNDLADLRRTEVGIVFQDDNLIDELTAAENVALPLLASGIAMSDARHLAAEALARVAIGDLVDRRPWDMSGGQRQRVGIARALVGDRRVLLADEPTGALDSRTSRDLFALVGELCRSGRVTALLATHDPIARDEADEVWQMTDGRIA